MALANLRGRVTAFVDGFDVVESPEAPAHLQRLHLRPWQMGAARVGDTVELAYRTTPSSGLWKVVRVTTEPA